MASVKYAREFAQLCGEEHVMLLSQDDKTFGLPVWKKKDILLMLTEYRISLPEHDFPIGEGDKFVTSGYV